jgi:hypothetical protein
MSVGTAPKRRLLLALLVAVCALGIGAQPPDPDIDDRPPLPPEEPKRPAVKAEFRYPNPTRRIFDKIQDDAPVRSEKQNADEYQAWTDVILTVKEKTAADLEDAAVRDLTPDDLLKANNRKHFRLELIRFDGKLTKVRKLDATKALKDIGIQFVFECWLVPDDEPPTNPVCAVVTDLPAGLEPAAEMDRRVSFAGYFFKTMAYPGPDYNPETDKKEGEKGWRIVPLLVGRSVTPQAERPANPEAKLDKNLRAFRMIKDDAPMTLANATKEEYSAWNRVLLHARRFSPSDLEAVARKDVEFHQLFKDETRRDYKLDLVYFEGVLVMLRKMELSQRLKDAGVETLYEGWLIPKDEPSGNPICVVFTDLPPDIPIPEKASSVNRWVSFAGYSFKRIRYESQERDRQKDSAKWKAAPLLLGHGVQTKPDPRKESPLTWSGTFVPMALGVVIGLVVIAGALTWFFSRGDRKARREIDANRKNPFGEVT